MSKEDTKKEKWSIDTTKEIIDAKKKKSKDKKGRGITFRPYVEDLKTRVSIVEAKREKIFRMGSEKLLAKQRERGKLTARERIALFFDEGTFVEHGIFGESQVKGMGMDEYYTPTDGVICGFGEVNGRRVCAYATDYSVLAGSSGEGHQIKVAEITKLATAARVPIVGFIDSSGARLHEAAPCLRGYYDTFWLQSNYSGVIPQITIICGGCAAGQAYSPVLTDFVIMTKSKGTNMWLGGPRATAALTREDITEIGGAEYHMEYSGSCHYAAEDDREAIEVTKKILSFCPSSCEEKPPHIPSTDNPVRQEEKLLDILPEDPRRTYDMHEVIRLIVDDGDFLEIMDGYARSAIVGFCRFDGYPCGIYAGNPAYLAGCLEPDACDKVTRFITFCDCFNIPMIYFVDTPAITVGDDWERMGVIRHATKLLHTTNSATIPRVCILVRKAYGGTLPIFCARPHAADFVYVWPTAEYAPMGADGAVAIIYDRKIRELPTSEERLEFAETKKKEYFDEYVDPIKTAANLRWNFFDDIIDPRRTRQVIINALKMGKTIKDRVVPRPLRKQGNRPV
ncbi:MAG: acyl-CoA carboxylase subunit beta [Deltaproteobacteria bacterium]|nr:acyl-CoA carboxylase subunit beta [Deltaproteobacteria bacterium]